MEDQASQTLFYGMRAEVQVSPQGCLVVFYSENLVFESLCIVGSKSQTQFFSLNPNPNTQRHYLQSVPAGNKISSLQNELLVGSEKGCKLRLQLGVSDF